MIDPSLLSYWTNYIYIYILLGTYEELTTKDGCFARLVRQYQKHSEHINANEGNVSEQLAVENSSMDPQPIPVCETQKPDSKSPVHKERRAFYKGLTTRSDSHKLSTDLVPLSLQLSPLQSTDLSPVHTRASTSGHEELHSACSLGSPVPASADNKRLNCAQKEELSLHKSLPATNTFEHTGSSANSPSSMASDGFQPDFEHTRTIGPDPLETIDGPFRSELLEKAEIGVLCAVFSYEQNYK